MRAFFKSVMGDVSSSGSPGKEGKKKSIVMDFDHDNVTGLRVLGEQAGGYQERLGAFSLLLEERLRHGAIRLVKGEYTYQNAHGHVVNIDLMQDVIKLPNSGGVCCYRVIRNAPLPNGDRLSEYDISFKVEENNIIDIAVNNNQPLVCKIRQNSMFGEASGDIETEIKHIRLFQGVEVVQRTVDQDNTNYLFVPRALPTAGEYSAGKEILPGALTSAPKFAERLRVALLILEAVRTLHQAGFANGNITVSTVEIDAKNRKAFLTDFQRTASTWRASRINDMHSLAVVLDTVMGEHASDAIIKTLIDRMKSLTRSPSLVMDEVIERFDARLRQERPVDASGLIRGIDRAVWCLQADLCKRISGASSGSKRAVLLGVKEKLVKKRVALLASKFGDKAAYDAACKEVFLIFNELQSVSSLRPYSWKSFFNGVTRPVSLSMGYGAQFVNALAGSEVFDSRVAANRSGIGFFRSAATIVLTEGVADCARAASKEAPKIHVARFG